MSWGLTLVTNAKHEHFLSPQAKVADAHGRSQARPSKLSTMGGCYICTGSILPNWQANASSTRAMRPQQFTIWRKLMEEKPSL